MEFNSSYFTQYSKDLEEAFKIYQEIINPMIVQFEILKAEFPIEVLNEIRAIYGHLCRGAISNEPEKTKQNVEKILSHTKRAVLDCFKYSCILYIDEYNDFFKYYKDIDYSYIDNGMFINKSNTIFLELDKKLQFAKVGELANLSTDELCKLYEEAYNEALKLHIYLDEIKTTAEFLKKKATKKEIITIASFIVGVAGLIVGILSLF